MRPLKVHHSKVRIKRLYWNLSQTISRRPTRCLPSTHRIREGRRSPTARLVGKHAESRRITPFQRGYRSLFAQSDGLPPGADAPDSGPAAIDPLQTLRCKHAEWHSRAVRFPENML